MRASSKKEAAIILLIGLAVVVALFADGSRESATFLGETAATAINIKFIFVVLIACAFLRNIRIPILAVVVAFLYESYRHLTLQEFWDMLGANPSFLLGFTEGSFAALVLLSLVHIVFKLDRPRDEYVK